MKKRLISVGILVAAMLFLALLASRIKPVIQEPPVEEEIKLPFKLGVILPADETERDTKAHMDAIVRAAKSAGISVPDIVWKERIEEGRAKGAAKDLLGEDCTMILAADRGYAERMAEFALDHPEVSVVTVTDAGITDPSGSLTTLQMDTGKACYIAGAVAGMKIKEVYDKGQVPEDNCQKDGKIKIGYVADYDEERSGEEHRRFLQGVHSVFPNVTMEIRYTGARHDMDAEASAADTLIRSGCLLIGCNTDSARVAEVVARAKENKKKLYFVGWHNGEPDDGSMEYIGIVNEWEACYRELFQSVAAEGEIFPVWRKGYDDAAVTIRLLPDGVEELIEKTEERWLRMNEINGFAY